MTTAQVIEGVEIGSYFTFDNTLCCVVSATSTYVTIEDCLTLEEALMSVEAFNKMNKKEVTHVAVCSS